MLQHRMSRTLPQLGIAFGAALTLMAATGDPARAAGASLQGEGLHIASGALVDPNGRTWVSDHNGGFCRMTPATDDGPGRIEHPQVPGERGNRTCLGGLLPDAGTGPDAAGQPVFVDPSPFPDDEMALIPDGASPSSEVVRARWNRHTGLFEYYDTITMSGARGRPASLALGADDTVYVGFQRETTIQRIKEPASDFPQVEVVGSTSDGKGAQQIAAGRDADGNEVVYVNEAAGLAVLEPGTRATTPTPAPFTLPAGTAIGSMLYDLAADKLYLGTADATGPGGTDKVLRIDPAEGSATEHAAGFSMVGGVAKAPGGHLFVVDDPALLDPAEPMGTGRLFHVGLPAAHVTKGPLDDSGAVGRESHTSDTTPRFDITADGTVQCRLRGPGIDPLWASCGETYTVEQPLEDGAHTLSVRATDASGGTGLPEAFRFTVDTKAPLKPVVTGPADGSTVSLSPWFTFLVEDHAELTCQFDDEAAGDCRPGRIRTFMDVEPREHTLQVTQTDRAGNVSPGSTVSRFTVDPSFTPEPAPGWSEGPPSHKGSSLYTRGLHIATGALVDPDGRTWVSDHNGGFCRVTEPTDDGPGAIEHPSVPGGAGLRTCLGGLLPEAGTGPDAAGQPALFDPTPDKPGNGDEMALIPDGASPSSDVVRARWNPDSGLFEFHDIVTMIGDSIRPTAIAAGPDGAGYVIFQKSGTVQRIGSPAGPAPQVDVVGNSASGVTSAVAAVRNAGDQLVVYIAEDNVLTRLTPSAQRPPTAQPAPVSLDGTGIGAMVADHKRGHLYLGTAAGTAAGVDAVHRMDIGTLAVEQDWLTGYSMIGGLALRPDGVLFVLDDPALLDALEPMATGRMFHVGLPAAHIDGAPAYVNVARPSFAISGEEQIKCRLVGSADASGTPWQDCAAGAFQPEVDLADGEYRLMVRAVAPGVAEGDEPIVGLVEAHAFTVDTAAPARPRILSPEGGDVVGATPWFTFDAEEGAAVECRWNGSAAWETCFAGRTKKFTTNADHTLQIRAKDAAGNVSEESEAVEFYARGVVESVRIDSGPAASSQDPNPRFAFSTTAKDVEFACRLNTAAFTRCTSEKAYANLPDGDYVFEVRGRDAVGNVSPAARHAFRVDRKAPVLDASGFTSGAIVGPDVSFDLTVDEQAALSCTLDGAALTPCGSTIRLTGLTEGLHTITVVATDAAGNVSKVLTRSFEVRRGLPPAPAPEPSITVIDQASGQPLTIRIAGLDRRVSLAKLREVGVTVEVIPAQGTKLIRLRIFKLSGNGRNRGGRAVAGAAGRSVVTTVYRKVAPGRETITLTRKELRRVGTGRHLLEITPGTSRRDLGKSQTRRFMVER